MIKKELFLWDETFPSLTLKGEGTRAFLHGQTTTDVISEQKEKIFRSCYLSTKGKLKALLEIRLMDDMAELIILSGEINSIKDGFDSVIFPADKVNLEEINECRRVQIISEEESWKESEFDWLKSDDVCFPGIDKYKKISFNELEIWKIRQGIPSLDREINGETNPYELGLGDFVEENKGCYLGQEAIARFLRANSFKHQLRVWEANGNSNDFKVGKRFKDINKDDGKQKNSGIITSSIKIKENHFKGLALIRNHSLHKDHIFSMNGDYVKLKKPISFSDP